MPVLVRLAGTHDVRRIAALRRAWVSELGWDSDDPGFEDAVADWFAREAGDRVTWVAEDPGHHDGLVGMVNLRVFTRMPKPGVPLTRWGYLANLYVRPGRRGEGVGSRLLAALTTYADEHGFVRVVLSPSERSVPLYERAGFAVADSLLLRPGPDGG